MICLSSLTQPLLHFLHYLYDRSKLWYYHPTDTATTIPSIWFSSIREYQFGIFSSFLQLPCLQLAATYIEFHPNIYFSAIWCTFYIFVPLFTYHIHLILVRLRCFVFILWWLLSWWSKLVRSLLCVLFISVSFSRSFSLFHLSILFAPLLLRFYFNISSNFQFFIMS